jgi:hypothetical protein
MKHICTPKNSYYYDHIVKWLSIKYGDKIGRFLSNRLAKMIRKTNDFCMDNFRVAEVGTKEVKKFEEQSKNGCCGSYENKFIFKEKNKNRIFLIGYNYGH